MQTMLWLMPGVCLAGMLKIRIGHFRVSPGPLFQNESRCSAFDMDIIFHSRGNKTHFHKRGCAPSLSLKVRVFGTRTAYRSAHCKREGKVSKGLGRSFGLGPTAGTGNEKRRTLRKWLVFLSIKGHNQQNRNLQLVNVLPPGTVVC